MENLKIVTVLTCRAVVRNKQSVGILNCYFNCWPRLEWQAGMYLAINYARNFQKIAWLIARLEQYWYVQLSMYAIYTFIEFIGDKYFNFTKIFLNNKTV